MNEQLRKTLVDAVAFLESHGVAYALIGGLAASLRGQPRVTLDVDLVIAADVERALEMSRRLEASPFDPLFPDVGEVVERAFILPLRHRATGLKVDIAIGASGFERQLIARASEEHVAEELIVVASAEDLVIMKTMAGRPQDDQDVQGLLLTQAEAFDWDYCLRTAKELGDAIGQDLVDRLDRLRHLTE